MAETHATSVTTPDWLTKHGCQVRPSRDGRSCLVYLGDEPQYLVMAVPAAGKFSARVTQTVNGRRLDGALTYPSLEDALQGGLEELRKALGW